MLNSSQYNLLRFARIRKAKIILAMVGREMGGTTALTQKMIMKILSCHIRRQFGVDNIRHLPASELDKCLEYINNIQIEIYGKYHG